MIVGGVASFAQLLGHVIRISDTIAQFCDQIKDAPGNIARINDKLSILRRGLEEIQCFLQDFDDGVILPPDLRQVLIQATSGIDSDIKDIRKACRVTSSAVQISFGERFRWALRQKGKMDKLLRRLELSEGNLDRAIQLINL